MKKCSCKEILDNYHKKNGYRNVVKEIMDSTKENLKDETKSHLQKVQSHQCQFPVSINLHAKGSDRPLEIRIQIG